MATSTVGKYDYTDEEITAQAEALYNPEYQTSLDTITSQETAQETQKTRKLEDYDKYITQLLADTQLSVENSLLKRGMGRSTRAAYEISEGLADVNETAQEGIADIEEDYDTNMADLATQKATLASTYAQNVAAYKLQLMQVYENIREFEKELAAASGSSGSGSSSSSSGIVDLTGEESSNTSSSANGPGTGFYSGKLYVNGKLYTGTFGGVYYKNGVKSTSSVSVSSAASKASKSLGR